MKNFDENDSRSIAEFVWQNIPKHKHFVLATIDSMNHPWAVCLNLSFDEKLNIIWKSSKFTEHSKHIAENKNVSVCIFSKTEEAGDFGLYTKAIACEVTDPDELQRLLNIRYQGKEIPTMDEFLDKSEYRIYKAEINEAWVNDDRHIKTKVDLDSLKY